MSTLEKNLYKNLQINNPRYKNNPIVNRSYRGLSTVDPNSKDFVLNDISLIKQDIVNHFHIRLGEKLEQPEFGTIIWDVIFEPLTDALKSAIVKNVTNIINYDPRVSANNITVDSFEYGIQIYAELTFVDYNISEKLRFTFDSRNNIF